MRTVKLLLINTLLLIPFFMLSQNVGKFDTTITFNGEQRSLALYVPTDYSDTSTYRLMIGLHGAQDNSENYRNALIDILRWNEVFPNTIFVFPDGGSDFAADFYNPAGDEMIIPAAREFVEGIYSIDSSDVVLQGFSLGGRSAMKYGLDHPDDFKGLMLHTPAIQGWFDASNVPQAGLIYNYDNASEIPMYITVGSQDLYSIILENVEHLLKKHNARIKFLNINGLGHTIPGQQYTGPGWAFLDQPIGADYDIDLFEIDLPQRSCETSVMPECYIQNRGAVPITSVDINYQFGSENGTYTWSGQLEAFEHTRINLPVMTGTEGSEVLTLSVGDVNSGQTDTNTMNNSMKDTIIIATDGISLPIEQGFEGEQTGWIIEDSKTLFRWFPDTDYKKSGQASLSAFNTILLFYTVGNDEAFQSPVIDLSSMDQPILTYDIAYNFHRYTPPYVMEDLFLTDTFEVSVSTDCGETFEPIYKAGGEELATADEPITNALNIPDSWFDPASDEWRSDTFSLNAFQDATRAIIRFNYISDQGGSIHIDNIRIAGDTATSVQGPLRAPDIRLFPNPASTDIRIDPGNKDIRSVQLYDEMGRLQMDRSIESAGRALIELDVSGLNEGTYHVIMSGPEGRWFDRLILLE